MWIGDRTDSIGPVDGALGLHDDVTREPHVVPEVVVKDGGQAFVVEQLQVVSVEIVPDEHLAASVGDVEGLEDGPVATADGVDGVDPGVVVAGSAAWTP